MTDLDTANTGEDLLVVVPSRRALVVAFPQDHRYPVEPSTAYVVELLLAFIAIHFQLLPPTTDTGELADAMAELLPNTPLVLAPHMYALPVDASMAATTEPFITILLKLLPPNTDTGEDADEVSWLPSTPELLDPHAYALPVDASSAPALLVLLAIADQERPPNTDVGEDRLITLPVPKTPVLLMPQAYRLPVEPSIAYTLEICALVAIKLLPPNTETGELDLIMLALFPKTPLTEMPSFGSVLRPQTYALPVDASRPTMKRLSLLGSVGPITLKLLPPVKVLADSGMAIFE
jgi:hypothetical protein